MLVIGVSRSRDVSGLSCDFGCHVPPDVSALTFKLKAETLIFGAASNLRDVQVPSELGCVLGTVTQAIRVITSTTLWPPARAGRQT